MTKNTAKNKKGANEKFLEFFLELFFPSRCILCNQFGTFLCQNCRQEIIEIEDQVCPKCNRLSKKGRYCKRCRNKTELKGILAFGYFKDSNLKELVHTYKYEKITALSETLASLLEEVLKKERPTFDVIAFVPLSKKRMAWRGFNQSEILADSLSKKLGKPLFKGIVKIKETKTQVGLTKRNREKNLINSFKVKCGAELLGKRVLLIDDVATTGSTLEVCARTLKKSGAKSVLGLVLAKE